MVLCTSSTRCSFRPISAVSTSHATAHPCPLPLPVAAIRTRTVAVMQSCACWRTRTRRRSAKADASAPSPPCSIRRPSSCHRDRPSRRLRAQRVRSTRTHARSSGSLLSGASPQTRSSANSRARTALAFRNSRSGARGPCPAPCGLDLSRPVPASPPAYPLCYLLRERPISHTPRRDTLANQGCAAQSAVRMATARSASRSRLPCAACGAACSGLEPCVANGTADVCATPLAVECLAECTVCVPPERARLPLLAASRESVASLLPLYPHPRHAVTPASCPTLGRRTATSA